MYDKHLLVYYIHLGSCQVINIGKKKNDLCVNENFVIKLSVTPTGIFMFC